MSMPVSSRVFFHGPSAVLHPGPVDRTPELHIFGPALCGPHREIEMASYSTSELRSGMKVLLEGDPYAIVENEFVKPGKGQAFNRVKVRNLKNGRTIERTLKSGDTLEAADVMDVEMQYLYQDGDFFHFM